MGGFSAALKAKGIGLGIYTAHGNKTCQQFPGSLGHEQQDAALYKKWGVVFVKNDWCWRTEPSIEKHLVAFNAMRDALNATGVPMVHSIHWNYADVAGPGCATNVDCPLPQTASQPHIVTSPPSLLQNGTNNGVLRCGWQPSTLRCWVQNTSRIQNKKDVSPILFNDWYTVQANMWRVGGDIGPKWASVLRLLDINANTSRGASPGAWNDMDMLEVGNGMTPDQDRAHFSIWCIMASVPTRAGLSNDTVLTRST